MKTTRTLFAGVLLSAGIVGAATPALADLGIPGLPLPSATTAPTLPGVPTPVSPSLPGLPAVPSVPRLPALPAVPALPVVPALPALPAVPALPAIPALPVPGALIPPKAAAPQAGVPAGGMPFGRYIDDGLGRWLPPLPVITTPNYALPADLPIDTTGYDQKDYALPRNWTQPGVLNAAAVKSGSGGHGSAWFEVLAAAGVLLAGAGTVVLRRRAT